METLEDMEKEWHRCISENNFARAFALREKIKTAQQSAQRIDCTCHPNHGIHSATCPKSSWYKHSHG